MKQWIVFLLILIFCTGGYAKSPRVILYQVNKGDWLYKILRHPDLQADNKKKVILEIKHLNPEIKNPNHIVPGQKLYIPYSFFQSYAFQEGELKHQKRRMVSSVISDLSDQKPIDKPKKSRKESDVGLGFKALSTLSYSRIDATELLDNSKAEVISKTNYGFGLALEKKDYSFDFRWMKYNYTSHIFSIKDAEIHLAQARFNLVTRGEWFTYTYGFAYSQKPYLNSLNTTYLKLTGVNHPAVNFTLHANLIKNHFAEMDFYARGFYHFSASTESLSVQDHFQYNLGLQLLNKWCHHFTSVVELEWIQQRASTSVSKQEIKEISLNLGFTF